MTGRGFYVDFESRLRISMKQFPKTLASEIKGVSESLPAIPELWNMSPHIQDFLPEKFCLFLTTCLRWNHILVSAEQEQAMFLKIVVATNFQKLCKTVFCFKNAGPYVVPQNIL